MKNYKVTVTYSEKKGSHTIVETWTCSGTKKLMKTVCEALDILSDKDGNPVEPNLKKLEESLGRYADADFIGGELKRQKKAFKLCGEVSRLIPGSPVGTFSLHKVDSRTTLKTEVTR